MGKKKKKTLEVSVLEEVFTSSQTKFHNMLGHYVQTFDWHLYLIARLKNSRHVPFKVTLAREVGKDR